MNPSGTGMFDLSGRTAIITGASGGLGRVLCDSFVASGADLVICARDKNALESTRLSLEGKARSGQKIIAVSADVGSSNDVAEVVRQAINLNGAVHILVNNAGIYGPIGNFEEVDWGEFSNTLTTNVLGPALFMRALIPHFKERAYGKIVNLSGGGATAPLPRFGGYAASKAALVRLTETIACECEGYGIDVNALAPGALNTRMLDQVLEAGPDKAGAAYYEKAVKQKSEGGASAEAAAQLCLFLSSDASNGISGKLISAVWDRWIDLPDRVSDLRKSDIYTLRRIVPADRGANWE